MTKTGWTALILALLTAICGVLSTFDFVGYGVAAGVAHVIPIVTGAIMAILSFLTGKKST